MSRLDPCSSSSDLCASEHRTLPNPRGLSTPLHPQTTRKLHVIQPDGHPLGVEGADLGVHEQVGQVRFGGFLEGADRGRLEAKIRLVVLGDLSYQPLGGEFTNE